MVFRCRVVVFNVVTIRGLSSLLPQISRSLCVLPTKLSTCLCIPFRLARVSIARLQSAGNRQFIIVSGHLAGAALIGVRNDLPSYASGRPAARSLPAPACDVGLFGDVVLYTKLEVKMCMTLETRIGPLIGMLKLCVGPLTGYLFDL